MGPNSGAGGGASLAFRARLEETAALIAPPLLIVGLALGGGGFELSARHIAGLAVWLLVVALLAFGAASRATLGRPLYWAGGLILGLAFLSAISSLWSGSVELSVTETDRVLVYLGFFLAAFLIAQTDQRRQRFAEGIAIALALVAFLALASRLLPHLIEAPASLEDGTRTRYPLGYWNAVGAACGIGAALLLWGSRRSLSNALRWVAVGSLPALLLALYFTYSRGGVLALVVACGCFVALSHDRLWLLATLAIAVLGTVPAILAVQARHDPGRQRHQRRRRRPGPDRAGDPRRRHGGRAGPLRPPAPARARRRAPHRAGGRALARPASCSSGIALVAALLAIATAIAVGGRAWDQFASSEVEVSERSTGTFRQPLRRRPPRLLPGRDRRLRGKAAARPRRRHLRSSPGSSCARSTSPCTTPTRSTCEAFAELGVVGGLLILALVGLLLWTGFAAWRAAEGAAAGALRGAAGGAASPSRSAPRSTGSGRSRRWARSSSSPAAPWSPPAAPSWRARARTGTGEQRRFGLAVGGPGDRLDRRDRPGRPAAGRSRARRPAKDAAAEGKLANAVEHAETARSIEPWAASPYVSLGLLAEAQGDYGTASGRLSQAIHREDRNWQLYFLRSRVEHEAGNEAAARADLERARELDPLGPRTAGAARMTQRVDQSSARPAGGGTPAAAGVPAPAHSVRRSSGPSGSRRRGALLRRLLAGGDWAALIGSLCLASPRPPRPPTSRTSSGRCSSAPPGSSWSSSTASTTTTTGGSATAPSTSCPRWSRPACSAPWSSTACWR